MQKKSAKYSLHKTWFYEITNSKSSLFGCGYIGYQTKMCNASATRRVISSDLWINKLYSKGVVIDIKE